MNKLIFSSALILLALTAGAQKVIENPKHGICAEPKVKITKIELNDSETVLTFRLDYPPGTRFGIASKSYIQVVGQPDSLFLTGKELPTQADAEGWHTVPEEGVSYKLFFPPIDPNIGKIDFKEPHTNPWNIYDIEISEQPHQSVIPKELLGNWFSNDNGNWTFSFFDSLAVYAGKTWEYVSVTPDEDNVLKIDLKNRENKTTLFCRPDGEKYCFMRSDKNTLLRFSNDENHVKKITGEEVFKAPVIEPGKVVYSGIIWRFSTRLGKSTGLIRYLNRLNNRMESNVISIQKDGSFTIEFALDFPQEITVNLPSGNERVFFEPGKPLFHLTNSGLKDYPSLFMGESAAVNYGLYDTREVATPMMAFIDGIIGMSDEEYIDHVLETKKDEKERLKKLLDEKPISQKVLQIRMLDINFSAANNAIRYNGNMNMAKFYANRQLKDDEKLPIVPLDFNLSLLGEFNDTPVKSDLAFISNEYFSLLQSLKYMDLLRQQGAYYYRLLALEEDLKEKNVSFTGEEKDMFEFIRLLAGNYDDEQARNFNQTYREVLQKFNEKYKDEMLEISNRFYLENIETNLNAMEIEPEGLPLEIIALQNYLAGLKNEEKPLSEAEFQEIKEAVKTDYLKELVFAEYYHEKAQRELSREDDTPELKTEGDKLFHSIIQKYRGKVVYVDFWATWCGPCLAGIEKIKPLKQELTGEDVVFLYITNPTSPEDEYKKRIPDIKGEHVRVSGDDWNYLTAKFNIYGIPHYALVDKNGKFVNAHLMFMENSELKKQLTYCILIFNLC